MSSVEFISQRLVNAAPGLNNQNNGLKADLDLTLDNVSFADNNVNTVTMDIRGYDVIAFRFSLAAGTANCLYRMQATYAEYSDVSELTVTDFSQTVIGTQTVLAGNTIGPNEQSLTTTAARRFWTAVRIQYARVGAGTDPELTGLVRVK